MFGLFNYNGPVVQTLNKVADGICLSVLWLPLALIYGALGASCYSCYLMCSAGNLPKEMLQNFTCTPTVEFI